MSANSRNNSAPVRSTMPLRRPNASKKSRFQEFNWYYMPSCSAGTPTSTAVRPQAPAAGGRQYPAAVRQNRGVHRGSASGGAGGGDVLSNCLFDP